MKKKKERYWTAYVIELEHGKYYVGITSYRDVSSRLKMHKNGIHSSKYMAYHKPIKIIYTRQLGFMNESTAAQHENTLAIEMQCKYGVGNVYGGLLS